MKAIYQGVVVALIGAALAGCSSWTATPKVAARPELPAWGEEQPQGEPIVKLAPGVVEQVWEEPMVDVVDVPPGLDPEGNYYRPAHRSVVEIRQGRWQRYDAE